MADSKFFDEFSPGSKRPQPTELYDDVHLDIKFNDDSERITFQDDPIISDLPLEPKHSYLVEADGKKIYDSGFSSYRTLQHFFNNMTDPRQISFGSASNDISYAINHIEAVLRSSYGDYSGRTQTGLQQQWERQYLETILPLFNSMRNVLLSFLAERYDSANRPAVVTPLTAMTPAPTYIEPSLPNRVPRINDLFDSTLHQLVQIIPTEENDYKSVPNTQEYQIQLTQMRLVSDHYSQFLATILHNFDILSPSNVPYLKPDPQNSKDFSTLGVAGWLDRLYADMDNIDFEIAYPALYKAIWNNDDRSGVLLLAVNSAEKPSQAKVFYYFLSKLIVDVLKEKTTAVLANWYNANYALRNYSKDVHDAEKGFMNPAYRLSTDDFGNLLSVQDFFALWTIRLDELHNVLLGRGQFQDWHHDWIEWLAHMINVGGGEDLQNRRTLIREINEFKP